MADPADIDQTDQDALAAAVTADAFTLIPKTLRAHLAHYLSMHGATLNGFVLSLQATRGNISTTITVEWIGPDEDREAVLKDLLESATDTTILKEQTFPN